MNGPVALGRNGTQAAQGPVLPLSLPSVAPQHVETLNALYGHHRPLIIRLAGQDARLTVAVTPVPPTEEVTLSFAIDGRPGEVTFPASLLALLVRYVDPKLSLEKLAPEHVALVLELAMEVLVSALEGVLGNRIEFLSTARAHPELADQATLPFTLSLGDLPACAIGVRLTPFDIAGLVGAMKRMLGLPGSDHGIHFPACLRIASATVTRSELATLAVGDVVLADESARAGRVVAVVAEHLAVEIELVAAGAKVASRPVPLADSQWEWCREMPDQSSSSAPDDATDLGALPVRVVFELGRLELSFSEIRDLAPGTVLPLVRPLEETLDIVANGRRIGRGTLVRIGDSVGVRVTRLFADG